MTLLYKKSAIKVVCYISALEHRLAARPQGFEQNKARRGAGACYHASNM
jgi:hypothetical protein